MFLGSKIVVSLLFKILGISFAIPKPQKICIKTLKATIIGKELCIKVEEIVLISI
ncbi:hypothetical protein fh0823_02890 [Francisella halioticida]|nr:hypothetical protein fh0823_02890 [Francisella halioticida]